MTDDPAPARHGATRKHRARRNAVAARSPATASPQPLLDAIVRGAFSVAGPGFLSTAVLQLCALLEADCVFVGELEAGAPSRVRAVAMARDGVLVEHRPYPLAGTPCAEVVGREPRTYPSGVARLFPAAAELAELGAEGYIGVPLFAADGVPLGTLAAVWRTPIVEPHLKLEILTLFAARAAAEVERERALAALRERECELAEAQRVAHLGSFLWRLATNSMWWSLETYRIFGLTPETFSPSYQRYLELVHPEDRADVERAVKGALEHGRPFATRHRVRRPDGGERHVHGRAEVRLGADGKPREIFGTVLDVTEEVATADALRRIEEGDFDLAAIESDNPLGALSRVLRGVGQALEAKLKEGQELARITEEIGAGLVLDEVLEHLYESFRSVLPYDRLGLALIDEEGANVVARWARSNAAVMTITRGYSAPLSGSSLQRVLASRSPRILNDLEDYLAAHPDSESTARIVQEGMRSSLTCPLIAAGKPIGFLFFSSRQRDTYRGAHVEIYQRVAGQLATLVEKGKLYEHLLQLDEFKSRLLGMVAHDLKNPIAVVSTYGELLERGDFGTLSGEQAGAIFEMRAAADKMRTLVGDLLDARAIESGRLQLRLAPVPALTCLFESLAEHSLIARTKGIELELDDGDADPGNILADRQRLVQALGNLLSNAIKYSRAGTTVRIGAQRLEECVLITVRDQGIGIAEADLPRIFHDFERGSLPPTAGERSSGLGLAITRRIVEAHGGQVRVESRPGAGSTFSLTIPTAGEASAPGGDATATAARQKKELTH